MDSNAMIQTHNNTQALEYAKLIVKAAKETHSMYSAAMNKSKDLRTAKQSSDRTEKIQVLQKYIKQYIQFIESTTKITGVSVYYINIDDISKINLDEQLSIMEGIVFLKEAIYSATNMTFKMCLKKLMKQSGIFNEEQIDAIEAAMDMSKRDRWIRQL
ncbi:MAG: hypothetical protein MR836_07760 [Ruminococcus sp.]|nr:hypothetical protein [Ruminococcus sp.]